MSLELFRWEIILLQLLLLLQVLVQVLVLVLVVVVVLLLQLVPALAVFQASLELARGEPADLANSPASCGP